MQNYVEHTNLTGSGSQPRPFWQLDLTSLLLALVLFGFPFSGLIAAARGATDDFYSVGARVLTFGVAVALIFSRGLKGRLNWPNTALLLFMIVYAIRLAWDSLYQGNPAASNALVFYLVAIVTPTLAFSCCKGIDWDEKSVIRVILIIGTVFVVSANWMFATGLGQEWIDQEIMVANGNRHSFERLNPIVLGQTAAAIVLAAVCFLEHRQKLVSKILAAGTLALALYTVYLAGSRGPIVGLVVALVLLIFGSQHRLLYLAIAGVASYVLFVTLDVYYVLEQMRFADIGQDINSIARIDLYREGFDYFLQSPFLGYSFDLPISGGWPHNLFIEVLLATGIFGFCAFLTSVLPVAWNILRGRKFSTSFSAALFVQSVAAAQFSGSLWGTVGWWVGLAIMQSRLKSDRRKKSPRMASLNPKLGPTNNYYRLSR